MRNINRSKLALRVTTLLMAIALAISLGVLTIRPQVAHAQTNTSNVTSHSKGNPLCGKLGKSVQASQGAQMFCFPPQSPQATSLSSSSRTSVTNSSSKPSFGSNVDAALPQEDVTPSGVQIHGQSETSVASAGPYVVEAWNDGTGFFAPCGSPQNKEELTGFGFSTDGGKTFTDLGGLPNANCNT